MTDKKVTVMDTPEWSPQQTLVAALEDLETREHVEGLVVYYKADGHHQTITSSGLGAGGLLLASKMIERRALTTLEGYFRDDV